MARGADHEGQTQSAPAHDVDGQAGGGSLANNALERRAMQVTDVSGGKQSQERAAVYQIPNTEHMAYRLVRTLVYKRGVGIRETVW